MGEKIKLLRISKGLSQEQLGLRLGVKGSQVSRYETGERLPPLDVVVKLGQIFNVTTDYLLGVKLSERDVLILDVGQLNEKQRDCVAQVLNAVIEGFIAN